MANNAVEREKKQTKVCKNECFSAEKEKNAFGYRQDLRNVNGIKSARYGTL
jgi:hypothetical protein